MPALKHSPPTRPPTHPPYWLQAKHGSPAQDEEMSFNVAITVVRIQRHWRALVARRRAEAARQAERDRRRAAGLPSQEEEEQPVAEAAAPGLLGSLADQQQAPAMWRSRTLGRLRSMLSSNRRGEDA